MNSVALLLSTVLLAVSPSVASAGPLRLGASPAAGRADGLQTPAARSAARQSGAGMTSLMAPDARLAVGGRGGLGWAHLRHLTIHDSKSGLAQASTVQTMILRVRSQV